MNLLEILAVIIIIGLLIGGLFLTVTIFKTFSEQNKVCKNAGGELVSQGCLINNNLYQMVKPKSGWRILK